MTLSTQFCLFATIVDTSAVWVPAKYRANRLNGVHETLVGCFISFSRTFVSNCTQQRSSNMHCRLSTTPRKSLHHFIASSTSPLLATLRCRCCQAPRLCNTAPWYVWFGTLPVLLFYDTRSRLRCSYLLLQEFGPVPWSWSEVYLNECIFKKFCHSVYPACSSASPTRQLSAQSPEHGD